MADSPQTSQVSSGLDQLLETHIQNLSEILSRTHTLEEIELELATLNDLVYTYKRRDELLEKLLDYGTAEVKRQEILEALRAQRMRVSSNRETLARIHAKSHKLLERSARLVIKAQSMVNERAHLHAGYALEPCGLCHGVGGTTDEPCQPCRGKGSVLVHQPSINCPRCKGDGKAPSTDQFNYLGLCIVCRGVGWVMTHD